jgi:hypothetical protein
MALASITRSQGATVAWSGGFANGDVMVNGVGASPNGSVNFYCHAPSSAGQLTIPSATLLALPPGGGKLIVMNATAPQTVSASMKCCRTGRFRDVNLHRISTPLGAVLMGNFGSCRFRLYLSRSP